MMIAKLKTTLLIVLMFFGTSVAAATEPVDYLKQIKPLLAERCFACHGALKQEGGLRLDTAKFAMEGGDSGAAVTPGDPDESLIIQRVTATDESERMPVEGQPLKPEQIAVLQAWIAQQASAPADEQPEQDPREHWAFQPIVRPVVPQPANSTWVRNPIDAFVAQKHEQDGLTPQVETSRDLLVRRIYLDLVGLPPTEEELSQIDATGDDWYEPLVDRLLADPRHGERWARHWMDIWRYSDWWGLGDQLRNSQPHIWHWRDWIVESLNANMPYDEMVRLMLAADELYPNDPDKLRATGFLARNWALLFRHLWMEETVEHVSKGFLGLTMNCTKCHDHKYDPIAQVDFYRMRAFFEPYQARIDMVPGEPDLARDGIPRVFDGLLDLPTYRFEQGQEGQPDKSKLITPGVPEILAFTDLAIQPVSLPKESWQPERQPWVLDTYLATARKKLIEAEATNRSAGEKYETAAKRLEELSLPSASDENQRLSAETSVAEARVEIHAATIALEAARIELESVEKRAAAMRAKWAKLDGAPEDVALAEAEASTAAEAVKAERRAAFAKANAVVADLEFKHRCSPAEKKEALKAELLVARDALAKAEQLAATAVVPSDRYTILAGAKWTPTRAMSAQVDDPLVEFPTVSTGRRSALAAWITDRRNPLTARVAVNHIWARHMGAPLVATVFDFGRKGVPPTHPELLDWLAAELIDSGWDMKHLHRLIVLSSTYRMSSSTTGMDANLAKDPDNHRLWRRLPIRLESQVVRDSILSIAGTLDLSRGGPSVLMDVQADSKRRSLYFFHSNNDRNLFLSTFDEATVKECYRRDQSIIPQQALALSNSRLVHDAAGEIAARLSQPTAPSGPQPDDDEFIRRAFETVLGTTADGDEAAASAKALEAWRKMPGAAEADAVDRARRNLVWALLNHNDFVTIR